MNREVLFYNQIQAYRIRLADLRSPRDYLRVLLYVDTAREFAASLQLSDFTAIEQRSKGSYSSNDDVMDLLYEIERFVSAIHARNLFQIDGNLQRDYVNLDDSWRTKATTYVQHIRSAVSSAGLEEALHEAILQKVNELQREIDRNRTRLSAVTDVWLTVSEAIGKGAKNLEPVANLVDRIAGAFSGLRRSQSEQEGQLQLPPPERLGLPDLEDQ